MDLMKSLLVTLCPLKARKLQLTAKDKINGNTPLHVSAFLGKKLIMEAIMKSCDEELIKELLEEKNKLGDTPVHAAAAKDHHRFAYNSVD